MNRIVILGTGTGGTLVANRLRRSFDESDTLITCVDQDDSHIYQPGLLFVPFGLAHTEDIVRPRGRQLHRGIDYRNAVVEFVDVLAHRVTLSNGYLDYDVLIIATGAVLAPEDTEGLLGPGWMEKVFTFYTPEGAGALEGALATFDHGRLVVNVVAMPIKAPIAPLEFCFLTDWYLRDRGIRNRVELTYVAPRDGEFTRPLASADLATMLEERDIAVVSTFNTAAVDGVDGRLISHDGRVVPFDLPWSSRRTGAPRSSPRPRDWATHWASSRPIHTRCSAAAHPTSSRSATPQTCRSARRAW